VLIPKPNLIERGMAALGFADRAATNFKARTMLNFAGGQYAGARRDKTSMRNFNPQAGSADSDSIGALPTLRARSRDLARNAPIAHGARNTTRTNVVGSGLRLSSHLQRELLGLTDKDAEAIEDDLEVLFDLWASSKMASVDRKLNFYELQGVAFTSSWESGDCFPLRRYKEGTSFLALCVQLIEADRVSTPTEKQYQAPDAPEIRDGIEIDGDGEEVAYHVLNRHPGDALLFNSYRPEDWARIPSRGEAPFPLMLHLMKMERIGQSRGIPALAPVIESLKQLDRYAEAELMAAVVSAFFTVFIKTPDGGGDAGGDVVTPGPFNGDGIPTPGGEMTLGNGTVVDLADGEDISIANPNRPNPNFDPFFLAIIRQIGIALGIPYEVLIMHFSSSYTASKAAIETAWQYFEDDRTWLARNLCQPTYEWFLYELVSRGIRDLPGFLDDPIKRAAWCGSKWLGRAPIVLDAVKDATAAEMWIDLGVETVESVTTKRNGGDWFRNQEQRGRECAVREELKIKPASPVDAAKAKAAEAAAAKPETSGDN
jgi:lambda family phage portal protein